MSTETETMGGPNPLDQNYAKSTQNVFSSLQKHSLMANNPTASVLMLVSAGEDQNDPDNTVYLNDDLSQTKVQSDSIVEPDTKQLFP